ncbi:gliding motility-associated protein GldE [Marinilabiliaceae bacterium JC017]|nr:gliding motility-associated protein GldE [Marinilabiliaceae bacterium JC017]
METELIQQFILPGIFNVVFHPFTIATFLGIATTIVLLISSAAISGAEVAYFSLKPKDIEILKAQQTKKNKLVLKHLKDPELLLATILIANNFVNVGIVILSSFVATSLVDFGTSTTIKFIFEIIIITSLILFFGEILPKVYAAQFARKFAGLMAYPLLLMKKALNPLGILLAKSTNVVNKRIAKKTKSISLDDLSHALELTSGDITDEKDILEGIVKFSNINVAEIMTARVDVIDIEIKSDYNKVLQVIIESGYSRIPVFEDTPDNVKGILYVKDLLPHIHKENTFSWQSLIRKAYYVPETKMINDLLEEFQSKKIHMAIVVDEYGGTSGIVTLEDILEEIVGEISDELDDDEAFFSRLPDGSYVFEGKTQLNDFHKVTETDETIFESVRGDAETLAGLILEIKGEIPKKHETIKFGSYAFTILAADNRRIKKVKFNVNQNAKQS